MSTTFHCQLNDDSENINSSIARVYHTDDEMCVAATKRAVREKTVKKQRTRLSVTKRNNNKLQRVNVKIIPAVGGGV